MLPGCFNNYTHLFPQIIRNSGRTIINHGHYEDCLDHPDLKYCLVSYSAQGKPVPYHGGLCLPRACPDTILSKFINQTLTKVNSPLVISSVDSNTQNYSFPVFWLTYLTIFLILTFFLLTALATLISWKSKEKSRGKRNLLVSAFDMSNNMKHFDVRPNEPLNILDGVRALAMMWVVFGHSFGNYTITGPVNLLSIGDIISQPFYLLLMAGSLSVDTFFMLAGFFLAFIMLREKSSGVKYLLAIPLRALRIWPSYIISMMFFYSLLIYFSSGAFAPMFEPAVRNCSNMWRDSLFIANYFTRSEMCMGWGWYLQVDFQLFVFCLLPLFLYKYSPKAAYSLIAVCILGSIAYNVQYTYHYGIHIMADFNHPEGGNSAEDLYVKPWARCPPYLIGLIFGMLFMQHRQLKKVGKEGAHAGFLGAVKEKLTSKRLLRLLVQWSGIGIMAFFAFISRTIQTGHQWPQIAHSLYESFDKPLFVVGIILTVLPSTLGIQDSFFNTILTNKAFTFIARVSFCTYLVHIFILAQFIATINEDLYFNTVTVFITYLGLLVLSLFFGFVLTMTVELPFANLQKQLVQSLTKSKGTIKAESVAKDSLITKLQQTNEELREESQMKTSTSQ